NRIVLLVICLFLTSPLPYRYLSEKTFGTEKSVDPDPTGCSEHKNFNDPLSQPNWNGWSNSPSNSRFQDGIAAGLDADRVHRLKLKWALAYPGNIMAFSQATVVAGRVFVGSAGGKVILSMQPRVVFIGPIPPIPVFARPSRLAL